MKNAIDIIILPFSYQDRFKWGYLQKARVFIVNRLKEAIFIRKFQIEGQLPCHIPWYEEGRGEVCHIPQKGLYAHHLLSQTKQEEAIFSTGLVLPGQKLRLAMDLRMFHDQQRILLEFNTFSMDELREKTYFQISSPHPLIMRYKLSNKKKEREFHSFSSLPEQLKQRRVIVEGLDHLISHRLTTEVSIKLENYKSKLRIEKVAKGGENSFYYYCKRINQWFVKNTDGAFLIRKEQGHLQREKIDFLDLRALDVMEGNARHEAVYVVDEDLELFFQNCGIGFHGNHYYVTEKNLLDIIDILKKKNVYLQLISSYKNNMHRNFIYAGKPQNQILEVI